MVSYNDCDFIRELYAGYFITAVTRINNLAQRYEGGCEFQRSLLPIMILVRGAVKTKTAGSIWNVGRWRNGSLRNPGRNLSGKERCYENRKQEKNNGAKKKENGVLSVPSELLLTAGIPLDCDLMIETVPE